MKDTGFYYGVLASTYINISGNLAIYTTVDNKTIKVFDLKEKKLVDEFQLKDPNSEDSNEALEIYFRVSKVNKFKLNKESEETIDAFVAITEA